MKQNKLFNQSVWRAIKILEFLAIADGPVELKNISQIVGLNKSTAYRFLAALMEEGYVQQNSLNGKYSLGSKVTWLAAHYLDKIEVRSIAVPLLRELARSTGETIHMAILDRDEVSYIEKIDGHPTVRMASRVGTRSAAHCTALGKVLLSYQPEEEWKRYVTEVGLQPRTPHTIIDPDLFYEELRRVRSQGYAFDNQEAEDGIRCVAAPIYDAGNNVIAAVSISGWTLTMTTERTSSLVQDIQKTANSISQHLG